MGPARVAADAAPGGARRASPPVPDRPAGVWSRVAILAGGTGRSVGALALLALTALLLAWGPDARLRGLWFDFCQRRAPRVRVSGPAVIVAVDEPSLARYGQWPWPRQLLAELVDRVREARPAAIALDLLFPEADRFSGASLRLHHARPPGPLRARPPLPLLARPVLVRPDPATGALIISRARTRRPPGAAKP